MKAGKVPLVSIKCTVYNHAPYVTDCLEGLVNQITTFGYEIIVHDDASTDNSQEIIREYAHKYPDIIVPILQKENQYSLGGGRVSKAIDAAANPQSKYFAICEGDDYWTDPYKLQKQVDFLESHPEYAMCYTLARGFDQHKGSFTNQIFGNSRCSFKEMLIANPVCTLTTVYRKDIYVDYTTNVLPLLPKVHMGDYPRWLYYAAVSKVHCINEVTAVYRILSESASHTRNYGKLMMHKFEARDIMLFFDSKYNNNELSDMINEYTAKRIIEETFRFHGKIWVIILSLLKKFGLFKK